MRYSNLIAEMARKGITQQDVATILGITASTVNTKVNGKYPFTLDEATEIQKILFKDTELSYLFKKDIKN